MSKKPSKSDDQELAELNGEVVTISDDDRELAELNAQVKKKDDTPVNQNTGYGLVAPKPDFFSSDSQKPVKPSATTGNPLDPFRIGEAVVKQLYTGFGDIAPQSATQAIEAGVSALQPSNIDEFIKRSKSVDFQRFVREKENMSFYQPFSKLTDSPSEAMDKWLPKYREQFIQEEGLEKTVKSIAEKQPDIISRRLDIEKFVQKQKTESQQTLGDVPQSYTEVDSFDKALRYAANSGTQVLWQIPLTIITKGMSGWIMEAASVYDQQLDQLAAKHNISREEVIKRNFDKPSEGQLYAVAAAGLDRLSAGRVVDMVKKGGAPMLKKLVSVVTETITEPTQGMLEEMGGAKGAGLNQTQAFKDAWTVNFNKRVDEALGGLFGSGVGAVVSHETPAKVISDQKAQIKSSDDVAGAEKAADVIQENINTQPLTTTTDAIREQSTSSVLQHPQEKIGEPGSERGRMEPVQQGEETPRTLPQAQNQEGAQKEVEASWVESLDKELEDLKKTNATEIQDYEKVARAYHEEVRNPTMSAQEQVISEEITRKGISLKSIERGMEHELTSDMRKNYFGNAATDNLDQIAQRASLTLNPNGDGNEISSEQVWEFIKKFPHGRSSMHTPKGNLRLLELSNRYTELTGKTINRKIAQDIADRVKDYVGKEEENDKLSGFYDAKGNFDHTKALAQIKQDPQKFQEQHGLTDEEFEGLNQELDEKHREEVQRRLGGPDQRQQGKEGTQPSQGGPLSVSFGDTSKDPAQQAAEINSKPLTRAEGLGMGKGLATGTHISTESKNRYSKTAQRVKTTIKKPFVFLNENLIIPFRNKILNDNFYKFGPEDFEGDPFSDKKSIDGLTNKGIDKLADLVRGELQKEGYDSIYLPESDTQEGELIVFDKENVQFQEKGPYQQEAEKRVTHAEEALAAAQTAYDEKKKSIGKGLKEDQIDIFGNRIGDKGKLFEMGSADRTIAKEQLDDLNNQVEKSRQDLYDANLEVERAMELDQNNLFKQTEKPTKTKRVSLADKDAIMKMAVPKGKQVTISDIDEQTGEEVDIKEQSQQAEARAKRRVRALDLVINCLIS